MFTFLFVVSWSIDIYQSKLFGNKKRYSKSENIITIYMKISDF